MIEILIVLLLTGICLLADDQGYDTPDEKLVEIYDIPPLPYLQFVKFEGIALEKQYSRNITLKDLARIETGLAGEIFHPAINGYYDNYPEISIDLIKFSKDEKKKLLFPSGLEIRSTSLSWDRKLMAVISQKEDGIYLGIYDIQKDSYREIADLMLNDALGTELQWCNDNRHLLVLAVDKNRGTVPLRPIIPEKPVIEETSGKTSQTRTYTNLLKDAYDEKLFSYYFTSQPVMVDVKKCSFSPIGEKGIYNWMSLSPNNEFIIISEIIKPFSRQLPWYRFPRTYKLWDKDGNEIRVLHKRPLTDEIPIGGVYRGMRSFQWQPQKEAVMIWVEALDNGDPEKEVTHRDRIMLLEDVENGNEREIFRTEKRYRGIDWSEKENWFIVYDYDRNTFWLRSLLTKLDTDTITVIENRNIRDKYNDPGNLMHKRNNLNQEVFLHTEDSIYFLNRNGASPEGQFPYLKRIDLRNNSEETLFRSRPGFLEDPICFVDKELSRIAVSSQNQNDPRNYYIYDTKTGQRNWLTDYQDPYPEWAKLKKEIVHYEREDGIPLFGTLYLPPDYDGTSLFPLVLNAYPEEYTDAGTAGQSGKTADKFTYFRGASIRYFALSGYAVLAGASIPIIGDPDTVNETFITQTVSSVKAAIDYLSARGVIDPQKVGITGHSYGAFMVANVLAHSDLCSAGIAKSGAYNRTLTPFGFQSERRTFWEAKDFYLKVSPFIHAEKINQPLLLVHGEEDNNSGTYPIQSERLFAALKGNGATARLIMLPLEHHAYRARESNLLIIKEMIEWFDKYLK